jgi:hypothetical protein
MIASSSGVRRDGWLGFSISESVVGRNTARKSLCLNSFQKARAKISCIQKFTMALFE